MGLLVGVVGVGSYLIEIHDWKDQSKTNPQGSRALIAVRPHIPQIKWDFHSSQLFPGDCEIESQLMNVVSFGIGLLIVHFPSVGCW